MLSMLINSSNASFSVFCFVLCTHILGDVISNHDGWDGRTKGLLLFSPSYAWKHVYYAVVGSNNGHICLLCVTHCLKNCLAVVGYYFVTFPFYSPESADIKETIVCLEEWNLALRLRVQFILSSKKTSHFCLYNEEEHTQSCRIIISRAPTQLCWGKQTWH